VCEASEEQGNLAATYEETHCKMAEVAVGNTVGSPVFNGKMNKKSDIVCKCCEKLKLELDKTLLELSSA
jgi:hypothetical protein